MRDVDQTGVEVDDRGAENPVRLVDLAANIARDMNLVRLDLKVAHYYPDETILRYALRNESPETWTAAVAGGHRW